MDINSKVKEAISYGSKKLGYQSLREVQQKVAIVEAYLGGQDVFVCLPTGSGKSFALR
jgi:superfamily II DNA helicase RecQ